jgi:hypothetical protein
VGGAARALLQFVSYLLCARGQLEVYYRRGGQFMGNWWGCGYAIKAVADGLNGIECFNGWIEVADGN